MTKAANHIDESDGWTDNDLHDAAIASMIYAEQSLHEASEVDDSPGQSAEGSAAAS